MISIIISSHQTPLLDALRVNIEQTIGCDFEIIPIINPGRFSIARAYNTGASKAQYEILCFVHEDVKFRDTGWGNSLVGHFENLSNPGVLGVAGSIYKSFTLSSWSHQKVGDIEPNRCNFLQHPGFDNLEPYHQLVNPYNETASKVVCLDGLFLSMKKNVWGEINFDETTVLGFHAYDLDISLSVSRKFQNYVVYDILLEHFSVGRNDISWLEQTTNVHLKHLDLLPVIPEKYMMDSSQFEEFDSTVEKAMVYHLITQGVLPYKIYSCYKRLYNKRHPKLQLFKRNFFYAMRIYYLGKFKKLFSLDSFKRLGKPQ
jgi:hypothetical protein